MNRIAVLTSGGDAPGMNAAIRSVVRTANQHGVHVVGIEDGFEGLLHSRFNPIHPRTVGNIIHQGGTILGSARCSEFKNANAQRKAIQNLTENQINGLLVIGGNGSQMGSYALHKLGFPVIGIPSTIDNDLIGSEKTIGFATAVNTATEAIDKLRTTARSHHRIFIIEVMGRNSGFIAVESGLASGAEIISIPECEPLLEDIAASLRKSILAKKKQSIIVVAEGAKANGRAILNFLKDKDFTESNSPRLTVLGHIQRGGNPLPEDRILASKLAHYATLQLINIKNLGTLVGSMNSEIMFTELDKVIGGIKTPKLDLLDINQQLST